MTAPQVFSGSTLIPGSVESWTWEPNGPGTLRWTGARPSRLDGRDPIQLRVGPSVVWGGRLDTDQDSTGVLTASGWWVDHDEPARDVTGAATSRPNDAVDGAIDRGSGWKRPTFLASSPQVDDMSGQTPTLGMVLDAWASSESKSWWVNEVAEVGSWTRDTSPRWRVKTRLPLGADLENYTSRLVVLFLDSGATSAKATVDALADDLADVEDRYGRRVRDLNLRPVGPISSAKAKAIGEGVLRKVHARPGFIDAIEVTPGTLRTIHGGDGAPYMLRPWHVVRSFGWSDSHDLTGRPYVDVRVGRIECRPDGSARIEPVGLRPGRRFEDVAKAAVNRTKRSTRGLYAGDQIWDK